MFEAEPLRHRDRELVGRERAALEQHLAQELTRLGRHADCVLDRRAIAEPEVDDDVAEPLARLHHRAFAGYLKLLLGLLAHASTSLILRRPALGRRRASIALRDEVTRSSPDKDDMAYVSANRPDFQSVFCAWPSACEDKFTLPAREIAAAAAQNPLVRAARISAPAHRGYAV